MSEFEKLLDEFQAEVDEVNLAYAADVGRDVLAKRLANLESAKAALLAHVSVLRDEIAKNHDVINNWSKISAEQSIENRKLEQENGRLRADAKNSIDGWETAYERLDSQLMAVSERNGTLLYEKQKLEQENAALAKKVDALETQIRLDIDFKLGEE